MMTGEQQHEFRPAFFWLPIGGAEPKSGLRHACHGTPRNYPVGSTVKTLCGNTFDRRPEGKYAWFFDQCDACWQVAVAVVNGGRDE